MPRFGESLKSEREARDVTIEQIAIQTGIQASFLEALESHELHALPGPAFGKLYIRAYARVLGFDPQPLIDEYDREIRSSPPAAAPSPGPDSARPRPVGSLVASWRQARIAERNRPTDDLISSEPAAPDEDDDAVGEVEAPPLDAAAGHGPTPAAPEGDAGVGDQERVDADRRDEPISWTPPATGLSVSRDELAEAVPAVLSQESIERPSTRWGRLALPALLVLGLLVGASTAAVLFFDRRDVREPRPLSVSAVDPQPAAASEAGEAPAKAAVPAPAPDRTQAPAPTGPTRERWISPEAPRRVVRGSDATKGPGSVSVSEFGLGRRVVEHQVEGQDERFAEGTVVWFQTRALGGGPGEAIRHVWIHEGRAVQTIRLRLGGPDWRTQSKKTLRHVGLWAVEARDDDGRVLARADFACK